ALTPGNFERNRYSDTMPYDFNRIQLKQTPWENKPMRFSDYINASWIKMEHQDWIATQAPISTTIEHFWRMIWEEDVGVIVNLTRNVEGVKVKGTPYWPDPSSTGQTSWDLGQGMRITLVASRILFPDDPVQHLTIQMTRTWGEGKEEGEEKRTEILFYPGWKDGSAPSHPGTVLSMRDLVKELCRREGDRPQAPAVVHCSAGCGRTGAFIALDLVLQELDTGLGGDHPQRDLVVEAIHYCRQRRIQMVQTKRQIGFLY
ncbi:protein-tyrosine phosphatase-like protein, partial [Piptocephalis cylindrospora]